MNNNWEVISGQKEIEEKIINIFAEFPSEENLIIELINKNYPIYLLNTKHPLVTN